MKHKYGTYFIYQKNRLKVKILNIMIILKTSTQEHFKNIKSNLRIRSMNESAPKNRTPACNTDFASGGVMCKLGALCLYSS
jgi:hypothetical protein